MLPPRVRGRFVVGMGNARRPCVGAKRLEELAVWQLANELRGKTHAIIDAHVNATDFRFCNQMHDAASSITRNIAEGFGRYRHKEFA